MVNERIKELANECGLDTRHNGIVLTRNVDAAEAFEKFAELIVQECINTVQKRFMGDLNREDMEVLRCVSELKNHFGVE